LPDEIILVPSRSIFTGDVMAFVRLIAAKTPRIKDIKTLLSG